MPKLQSELKIVKHETLLQSSSRGKEFLRIPWFPILNKILFSTLPEKQMNVYLHVPAFYHTKIKFIEQTF